MRIARLTEFVLALCAVAILGYGINAGLNYIAILEKEKQYRIDRNYFGEHVTVVRHSNISKMTAREPVILEIGAPWCLPCEQQLKPRFKQLADRYHDQIRFGYANYDLNQDLMNQYKIIGVPSSLLFSDGTTRKIDSYSLESVIQSLAVPPTVRN